MTALEPAPGDDIITGRPHGNHVDLHYLEETRAALRPVMAICEAVWGRAIGPGARTLARDARSAQDLQLEAISACLLAWGQPGTSGPRAAVSDALPGLQGASLDAAFVDQLTAHAHASIASARVEMVAGTSPSVRAIARDGISTHYRLLAALELLSPTGPARA